MSGSGDPYGKEGQSPDLHNLAEKILMAMTMKWAWEFFVWDTSQELVNACSREELKQVCSDVIGTSHRNIERYARYAQETKDIERCPDKSPRTHLIWARQDAAVAVNKSLTPATPPAASDPQG